jgi:hypothetical protein
MAKWEQAPLVEGTKKAKWESAPLVSQASSDPSISDRDLITQLGGQLPNELPIPQMVSTEFAHAEQLRRYAFDELVNRGYKPEQLELTAKIQRETTPSFLKDVIRPNIGQMTGGTAGGALGGTLIAEFVGKIPPLTVLPEELVTRPVFAAIGAGIGGAIGKGSQVGVEERRWPDFWKEILPAAGSEAATEGVGRYGAMGLKFALGPLIKKSVPEAAEIVQRYGEEAVQLDPAQLDKRLSLRLGTAISRNSVGAEDIWAKFGEKQSAGVEVLADQIQDNILGGVQRLSPQEATEVFATGITEPDGLVMKWLDDLFTPLYKKVDEVSASKYVKLVGDVEVPSSIVDETGRPFLSTSKQVVGEQVLGPRTTTKPLKEFAEKKIAEADRMMKAGKGIALSAEGRTMLEKIAGLKDEIGFGDLRDLRSTWLNKSRKLARDIDESQAIAKQVAGIANDLVYDPQYTKGLTPEARRLLENTNRLYRSSREVMEKNFPERLAKSILKNPAQSINRVFPDKNPKAVATLRNALIEPVKGKPSAEGKVLWNQLTSAWLGETVDKSIKETGMSATTFNNTLHKIGDDTLKEMFPDPAMRQQVKDIGIILKDLKRPTLSGMSLVSKSVQFGGAAEAYYGAKEGDFVAVGAGLTLALGPVAFAKLATSKTGKQLLLAGVKAKPGSSEIGPLAVRMINALRQIDSEEIKQEQQAKMFEGYSSPVAFPSKPFGNKF